MKPGIRHSVLARFYASFGQRFFRFALGATVSAALGAAGMCQTQPQSQQSKSTPAAAPTTQKTKAAESADNGLKTGIKVHGHWVIDVKNPNGKLISHHEFENALEQATGGPTIAQILGGTAVAGEFAIALPVPCSSDSICILGETGGVSPSDLAVNITNDVSSAFGNAPNFSCVGQPAAACTNSLNVSVSGGSIVLQGSVVAVASGSIGGVESYMASCANTGVLVSYCLQTNIHIQPFTGKLFTAIPFSDGQTITVTVTISFQ
ncbi:MAG TPA: hypothetical protein VME23_05800 [Terracidiphilus sp.]|nr:hypothetical protein [Terracidiphilus sp.]